MNRVRSMRTLYSVVSVLVLLALVLTACATPTPAPTVAPTKAPEPTKAPAAPTAVPTKAPEPTKAVEPTKPAATAVPPTATPLPVPTCAKLPNALTPKAGELGSADKPIVITFVPSVDVSKITKGGQAMAECLTKMTGLNYKVEVGTSEAASIEAMGGGKAHMGFLNTFAILLAKQKYDVEVALVAQRYYGVLQADGKTWKGLDVDPDKADAGKLSSYYKPEYFTKVGSGIKTLADVKGKKFCFTTASSTSGGIIPRASLAAIGINPDKDIQGTYAGGHDKAAIAVYQGDCDAGVAFMDILTDSATKLYEKFPDISTKLTIFAVGDRIPNDGLQYIKGLDAGIKSITTEALLAMMADKNGNAVVKSIYAYDAFEKADYAKYYGPFDELLKKAGIDVSKLVKQ